MAYNFKNLADVELLNVMPETANVLVEVDGTTKRAPQVDEISKIVGSEALTELPETGTVLAEVNGEIKRVPNNRVGGAGTLDEMPGIILLTVDINTKTFSCNKTFKEVLNMIKNSELQLVLATGIMDGYMTMPLQVTLPRNSGGEQALDDTATNILFQEMTLNFKLYLLNDNTVTFTDPCAVVSP